MARNNQRLFRSVISFSERYAVSDIAIRKSRSSSYTPERGAPQPSERIETPIEAAVSVTIPATSKEDQRMGIFARLFGHKEVKTPRTSHEQNDADGSRFIESSAEVARTHLAMHEKAFSESMPEPSYDEFPDFETAINSRPTNEPQLEHAAVEKANSHIADVAHDPFLAALDLHNEEFAHLPLIAPVSAVANEASTPAAAVDEIYDHGHATTPALASAEDQPQAESIVDKIQTPVEEAATTVQAVPEPKIYHQHEVEDNGLGGFSAFFQVLTPDEIAQADAQAATMQVTALAGNEEKTLGITWPLALGLDESPTDPDDRVKLVYLAIDLGLMDIVRQAAEEDPHTAVRMSASQMLDTSKAA